MTAYYVRTTANGGSDAANGLSPATAWATIGKALGAAGMGDGDDLYVGAGDYDSAIVTVGFTPTGTTHIYADVTGEFTGDAGEVNWTPFNAGLSSNPTTRCLDLNGKSYLHFHNFIMYGGSTTPVHFDANTAGTHDITFTDCVFACSGYRGSSWRHTTAFGVASNILFDRCHWFIVGGGIGPIVLTSGTGADYDSNITYRNCTGISVGSNGGVGFGITKGGALANLGGGVRWENCSFLHSGANLIDIAANAVSATYPCEVYDCDMGSGSHTALVGGSANQLVENYNCLLSSATARDANVATGASSLSAGFFGRHSQQAFASGMRHRPLLSPTSRSLLTGRGTDASVSLTVDGSNRPRPTATTLRGWGALERHDTATKETSVTDAGGVAIKITGPGDQDIQIPVSAAATTITVRCRYDTNHAATNKPQAILIANGEIGVSGQTVTGAAAIDTWETLSIGPFTPTAAGVVTVRLVSRSAAANGIAYFDSVTVA